MNMRLQTQVKATSVPNPTFTPVRNGFLQRKCSCGGSPSLAGECAECRKKRLTLQRRSTNQAESSTVPPIVREVLSSPGQPLDPSTRTFMESHFGHDFSQVRVHTDTLAAESAQAVNAVAYTVGRDVVFGAGQYVPEMSEGRRLLAHELTHVVQQGARAVTGTELSLSKESNTSEVEAGQMALTIDNFGLTQPLLTVKERRAEQRSGVTDVPAGKIQRQFVTPLGPGGGFSGLMERDREYTRRLMSTPFHVCARPLQNPILGLFANHAYIESPPYRYAVISPLCTPTDGGPDNVITGAVAHKWDNSPDPCGKTPRCVPCQPKPGVSDVARCLRDAFNAYNDPTLYKGLGPNSNTFAGTLARACCDDMVPKPSELGTVPGWDDSPAPTRSGVCPPAPTC